MQSVTEIQLNKLRAHFRARFAPMIWANCAPLNVWGGGDYYIGANQAGKRARSLFNCRREYFTAGGKEVFLLLLKSSHLEKLL